VARWAAQNDHFIGFYKTWTRAVNFLIGEHWRTKWDGTSMSWTTERDIPPWHQQPVTNMTFAVYRSALAKLTKQKPTLEVVPPSGDSEDKEAAELSEALLTYLWRYLRKPQKLPVALGWMLVTGQTYIRVGWDPEAGQPKPRTIPMQRPKQPLGADDSAIASPTSADDTDAQAQGDAEMEDVDVAADENGDPYLKDSNDPESVDFEREPEMEPTGEICFEVVSPLCVRLNPEATSIDDADEMYVGTLWPKKKAAAHFKINEDLLGGADESAESQALHVDLMSETAAGFPRSWADRSSSGGVSQQNAIGDRVLVVEFYAKQSDAFPKGRHWISCGAVKVWPPVAVTGAKATPVDAPTNDADAATAISAANDAKPINEGEGPGDDGEDPDFPNGEAPLPFGFWPPLVPILDTPIPGQPTALGVIPQIVPLNEQLNVLDGKIAEKHVMDSTGGIWFASPEDRGLTITSEPGQVIYSKAMGRRGQAFAPFQATMHPLPEPVYRERDVMTQKVIMVSGLSGLDLSQKPAGVTAGRAFLVMQETSDSVLMPTLFSVEAALEECGNRELIIAQQKYSEDRTIAIRASDGKWLFRSFNKADLRNGHDVRVQVGSSFPWSKSAQWDARMQFLEAVPGLYTDMATGKVDDAKLAKYLDTGTPGLGAFESDEDEDLVEIQREHSMFEVFDPTTPDGSHQVPQIAFWQNHPVHLQQHYNFMKKDFARFQRWSDSAKQAFMEHMQLTAVAVDDVANKMMGGPPGAPGGAPPGADPGADPNAPPGAAPGGAPPVGAPGAPGAMAPAPGGSPPGQMRLGRGDQAAAAS
jgi:hypothetical protein